jgi:hypothetical protein
VLSAEATACAVSRAPSSIGASGKVRTVNATRIVTGVSHSSARSPKSNRSALPPPKTVTVGAAPPRPSPPTISYEYWPTGGLG